MELNVIKGLGPTYQQLLTNNDINNIYDLIKCLPQQVDFYLEKDINFIEVSDKISIIGTIISPTICKNKVLTVSINSNSKIIIAEFENSHLLKKKLAVGKQYKFYGYYDKRKNLLNVDKILDKKITTDISYDVNKVNTLHIESFIKNGLKFIDKPISKIPTEYLSRFNYKTYNEVLYDIHNPKDEFTYRNAYKCFVYDVLFSNFTKLYYLLSIKHKRLNNNLICLDTRMKILQENIKTTNVTQEKISNIIKNFEKDIYQNILLEQIEDDDLLSILTQALLFKTINKKQVIIFSNKNEYYSRVKEVLKSVNVNMAINSDVIGFNRGSVDIIVTSQKEYKLLNISNVDMIIIDNNTLDIGSRLLLNNCVCDTIFITNTSIKEIIDNELNIVSSNLYNKKDELYKSIYECYLSNYSYNEYEKNINIELLQELINIASLDAKDFILNKRYNDSKSKYNYLKDNLVQSMSDSFKKSLK